MDATEGMALRGVIGMILVELGSRETGGGIFISTAKPPPKPADILDDDKSDIRDEATTGGNAGGNKVEGATSFF
jgi:hypothetical protein